MFDLSQTGPFGILAVVAAAAGVCIAVASVATRRRLDGPITMCAALAVLLGMAGTGFGLNTAGHAIASGQLDPELELRMFVLATGVAWSTIGVGALGAAADLVALAVAGMLVPATEE